MKVLMVCENFVSKAEVKKDSEYFAALIKLPRDKIFEDYRYSNKVDISRLPAMELRYDEAEDAIYWWADLAIVAVGILSVPPTFSDDRWSVFDVDESAEIESIDCLHGQIPVCHVKP